MAKLPWLVWLHLSSVLKWHAQSTIYNIYCRCSVGHAKSWNFSKSSPGDIYPSDTKLASHLKRDVSKCFRVYTRKGTVLTAKVNSNLSNKKDDVLMLSETKLSILSWWLVGVSIRWRFPCVISVSNNSQFQKLLLRWTTTYRSTRHFPSCSYRGILHKLSEISLSRL